MARVVKMSALLPEDIVIEMPGGQQFTLPGDPPLQTVLKIAALFERSSGAGDDEDGAGIEVLQELDDQMLGLLRMRDPDVAESPFGVIGVQHVVAQVLAAYNFVPGGDDADPPTRGNRATRRQAVKSTRSSG